MDREDIIRMAQEVTLQARIRQPVQPEDFGVPAEWAKRAKTYADFQVVAEREACARFLEETDICGDAVMDELAAAIRARGDHAQD